MEPEDVPRTISAGGRTWEADEYDWEVAFGWKTPFKDDEYDYDPMEVSATARGGEAVPHHFIHIEGDDESTYQVSHYRTNPPDHQPDRAGMIDGTTTLTLDEAVAQAKVYMRLAGES